MADVTLVGPAVDGETWMWLPDGFPTPFHPAAEDWVRDTAAFIRGFVGSEASDEECAQSAEAVLAAGRGRDDCLARFWHVPAERATLSIASVLAWQDTADDERPLSERAIDGFDEGALQSVRELEHPVSGEAVATIAIATSGSRSGLTVARWMARRDGVILAVEAIATAESSPARLLAMTPDLDRLFFGLTVWS